MKDIKLDTTYKKIQFWVSWIMFIFSGFWVWIVAYILAINGKTTSKNVAFENGVLNKTWEKFVYVYGQIMTYFILFILFMGLFL